MMSLVLAGHHEKSRNTVPGARPLRAAARAGALLAAMALLSGCALTGRQMGKQSANYRPQNVFLSAPYLPGYVRRVALLPLACDKDRPLLEDGCEELAPILKAELIRTGRFEVVPVDPEILKNRTGHSSWTGAEALPPDFFGALSKVYQCDAVLFCQLTVFHPYPPLVVGWRMRLVDAHSGFTLWAADEVFNAGEQAVANGAEVYQWKDQQTGADRRDDWYVRNSPRRFGQFAAARLLATLPAR